MSVVLDLPSEAEKMLLSLAKERNISQENLIKELLLEYLEDLEDARIGEAAYKEYVESGRESVAWQDFKKEIGL